MGLHLKGKKYGLMEGVWLIMRISRAFFTETNVKGL